MIRVAIADDMDMVRTGFRLIIDNEDDMVVVGDAANGVEAVELCRRHRVDVILMDIRMPELDGLSATRLILDLPEPAKVLVLTTFGLDEYVTDAVKAGASGFLLKDASADQLVSAVRSVANGHAVLSPAVTRLVLEQAKEAVMPSGGKDVPGIDQLTDRERHVLELLAAGMSNAEIAAELFLSEATIKTYVGRVLTKLGVRDRVQAVIAAFEAGITTPGDSQGKVDPPTA